MGKAPTTPTRRSPSQTDTRTGGLVPLGAPSIAILMVLLMLSTPSAVLGAGSLSGSAFGPVPVPQGGAAATSPVPAAPTADRGAPFLAGAARAVMSEMRALAEVHLRSSAPGVGGTQAPPSPSSFPRSSAPGSSASLLPLGGWGGIDESNASCRCIPSDNAIGVGDGYVMQMVNDEVYVWTTSGGPPVYENNLSNFFELPEVSGGSPLFNFPSDPSIHYDPTVNRWFTSVLQVNYSGGATSGAIAVNVSQGPSPLGPWYHYLVGPYLTACGGVACLPDQPFFAVDANNVVFAMDDFSSTSNTCLVTNAYCGAELIEMNKTAAMAGFAVTANQTYTGATTNYYRVVPVSEEGPLTNTMSLVTNCDAVGGTYSCFQLPIWGTNAVDLLTLTGSPPGTVTVTGSRFLTPPETVVPNFYGAPQNQTLISAAGVASPVYVAENSGQLFSAVARNGSLWTSGNDGCTMGRGTIVSCLRLLQINTTTSTVTQDFDWNQGMAPGQAIDDYDYYPTMMLDGHNDLVMEYGNSSNETYPSVMVVAQPAGAPPGTMGVPTLLAAGHGPDAPLPFIPSYCGGSAGAPCRWGDYFMGAQDPTNPCHLWFAGNTGASNWKTDWWDTQVSQVSSCGPDSGYPEVTVHLSPSSGDGAVMLGGVPYFNGGTVIVPPGGLSLVVAPNAWARTIYPIVVTGGASFSAGGLVATGGGALFVNFSASPQLTLLTVPSFCLLSFNGSVGLPSGTAGRFATGPPGYLASALPCAGSAFVGWSASGGVALSSSLTPQTTATLTDNGTLTATYGTLDSVTISVSPATCGYIAINGTPYANGALAQLLPGTYGVSASGCPGYQLSGSLVGSGGATVTGNQTTVSGDGGLEVSFVPVSTPPTRSWSVDIVVSPASCGYLSLGGTPYVNGAVATVTAGTYSLAATACSGFQISGNVSGSAGVSVAGSQATVIGNGSLTVTFVAVVLPPVAAWIYGTLTPSGGTLLLDNQTVALSGGGFSVSVAPGAHFLRAYDAGYAPLSLNVSVESGGRLFLPLALASLASPAPSASSTSTLPIWVLPLMAVLVLATAVLTWMLSGRRRPGARREGPSPSRTSEETSSHEPEGPAHVRPSSPTEADEPRPDPST